VSRIEFIRKESAFARFKALFAVDSTLSKSSALTSFLEDAHDIIASAVKNRNKRFMGMNLENFSTLLPMSVKKITIAFLICVFSQTAFALSESSDFLVVPSAEILGDKAFQIRGTAGYHRSSCTNDRQNMCDRHPFVSSLRFGLFNSLEIGVQFGSNISLDVKNQLNKSYGFVPAFALGARAFVQSPEAYFYSVPKNARKEQTGEFYGVAQWEGSLWKLLGGVSAFPVMDADAVAPFWGYEQGLFTQKFSVIYEGFFRHGFSHHNIGLSFKPIKALQISAGASEFYRYFFDDDRNFKFRIKNPGASTGYHAPGIYVSVAINGGFSPSVNQKVEVDSLKRQIAVQETHLADMRAKVENLEKIHAVLDSNSNAQNLKKEFLEIVKGYKSDELSLDSLRAKEKIFMDKGIIAKEFVVREAKDASLASENRIMAIRIMSHFPDSTFLEPLGSVVADSSNESVAREAALALGVINTPESRKILSAVVNQTTGIVRDTIIEIMGAL